MEAYIKQATIKKIKWLSFYQIAGGLIGVGLVIWLIAQQESLSGIMLIILGLVMGLYAFSAYCGWLLRKGETDRGLKLSTINQAVQVLSFTVLGITYKFAAGVMLVISFKYSQSVNLGLKFEFSTFQINVLPSDGYVMVSVNIFAIWLLYYIDKLKDSVAMDKYQFESSVQAAAENVDTTAIELGTETSE
jgi:hypothetical protein